MSPFCKLLLTPSALPRIIETIQEYAVGIQHRFPVAVEQIKFLYTSLRSGTSIALLGFQPSQIVLSGESVGGNLATALCVSLISDYETGQCVELTEVSDTSELFVHYDNEPQTAIPTGDSQYEERSYKGIELPNALLMSSPILSLSLDSTPSRVEGADDAVLPSALFAAISNSYVGPDHFKEDPLISPLFADDEVLRQFPTTLIFASSEDPLLDDSVSFNGRLRSLGVRSTLKAVSCVPHAFWALTTAGVPEARSVQRQVGAGVDFELLSNSLTFECETRNFLSARSSWRRHFVSIEKSWGQEYSKLHAFWALTTVGVPAAMRGFLGEGISCRVGRMM